MATTKSNVAYARLRRDIVTGTIPANSSIDEVELSERYGLGRTPIREALKQLRNDQLVVWPERRSPYVPEIGVAQVRHLYEARSIVETQIATVAADRITGDATQALNELVDREGDLVAQGMAYDAAEVDLLFHRQIAEATGNPFLVDASTRLNTCALRIWHDMIATEEMLTKEHADIVDTLHRRDAAGAVEAVQRHIDNAYQRYVHMTARLP